MIFNKEEYNVKIWKNEKIGPLVSIDTETTMVPFHLTPELITCQVYGGGKDAYYVPISRIKLFFNMHYDSNFLAHNMPFDADVLEPYVGREEIFRLYDNNQILDTSILYRLLHLAEVGFVPFKYSLAFITKKFLNVELDKDDDIRTNFEQFRNVDIHDIPSDFLEYGAMDTIATYQCWMAMLPYVAKHDKKGTLLSHNIQVKGDLALNHIRKNGIGFDLSGRDKWLKEQDTKLHTLQERLANWGWVRGTKGIKERYAQITEWLGIADKLPRTSDGSISSKRDDLEPYSNLPFVQDFLEFMELEKATSFVRNIDSTRVHPRYNTILNTGRTSCSSPNFQQLPKFGGIREMFCSGEDTTFLITDYSALELATLSQVLMDQVGYSVMGDRINSGDCLHYYYASVYLNKDIKNVSKAERQMAKAPNFGFPGGLGIETFIQFSRGYGLELTDSQAQDMKNAWFAAFPEVKPYMQNEVGHVYTLTGRKRGNTSYCAEKNTPFQGLAADGAKLALYNLDKAGFKVVGFVHDEIICEVPIDRAEDLLPLQEKIMIDSMKIVTPDIKIGVESMISKVYTK